MDKEEYPECDKLSKIKDQSFAIGQFLEWIESRGWYICSYREAKPDIGYFPVMNFNIESVLAEYFGIDLEAVEREKRQMLEKFRNEYLEKPSLQRNQETVLPEDSPDSQ